MVENFQETPAVPDGLAVMAQAYIILDMPELADNAIAALRRNYPQHPSLDEAGNFLAQYVPGEDDRSWANMLTFGLVDRAAPPLVIDAFVLAMITTVLASLMPALKASRLNIVDALRCNQ